MQTAPSQVTPGSGPDMATATALGAPRVHRRWRRQSLWGYFWSLVAWVVAIFLFFPVFWMVLTSFKTAAQALVLPVVWWPHPFLTGNYPQLFAALPFFRFFLNTFVYAGVTIVGVCISSSLVAYGFSRLRWRCLHFSAVPSSALFSCASSS